MGVIPLLSAYDPVAQAQRDAASIPEGMRILPEKERLQTLDDIAKSKADTEARLRVRTRQIYNLHNVRRLTCMLRVTVINQYRMALCPLTNVGREPTSRVGG